jgi:hypothetical protein
MGGNEELFGLEQTRGWAKLVERMKQDYEKERGSMDAAVKSNKPVDAAYHLGRIDCIKWMSQLPSQMTRSLPKEKING